MALRAIYRSAFTYAERMLAKLPHKWKDRIAAAPNGDDAMRTRLMYDVLLMLNGTKISDYPGLEVNMVNDLSPELGRSERPA
ncbi:unnamed protein product [Nippostrongylus brasiliensis]|uniref:Transposase n=1 Tax=Nippostrongylus brasiliensis TaxID=27835 RepID=A0A0N4Y9Z0_NIPBR|nr:unnamed protein product [Nippostrongylus brasiliensis]